MHVCDLVSCVGGGTAPVVPVLTQGVRTYGLLYIGKNSLYIALGSHPVSRIDEKFACMPEVYDLGEQNLFPKPRVYIVWNFT